MKKNLFVFFSVHLAASVWSSALSDAAAKLPPGTWAEFPTTGFTNSLISTGVDNILNYSNSAVWDPIKRELRFVGQGHMEAEKMIIYKESTNSWANAAPPGGGGIGHGYDHNALDPLTGVSYYRKYSSTSVRKFVNGAWGSEVPLPGTQYSNACCGALEFFPELNSLTFTGGGDAWILKNGVWTLLNGNLAMGGYHNVAQYNPADRSLYLGGGNGSPVLHRLDSLSKFTRIADCPVNIGIYSGLLAADPASGELLVFGRDKSFRAYSPSSNQWRTLSGAAAPIWSSGDNCLAKIVEAPIPAYGVNLFITRSKIYLYKHLPGAGTALSFALSRGGMAGISIFPNPAKGRVHFHLPGADVLSFTLFNVQGAPVAVIFPDHGSGGSAGYWDAAGMASGTYFVRMEAGTATLTRSFLFTR